MAANSPTVTTRLDTTICLVIIRLGFCNKSSKLALCSLSKHHRSSLLIEVFKSVPLTLYNSFPVQNCLVPQLKQFVQDVKFEGSVHAAKLLTYFPSLRKLTSSRGVLNLRDCDMSMSHLQEVEIEWCSYSPLAWPRNMHTLNIRHCVNMCLRILPPSLTNLNVGFSEGDECNSISSIHHMDRVFPDGLTSVAVVFPGYKMDISLPNGLKCARFDIRRRYRAFKMPNLPKGMTQIHVEYEDIAGIENFPDYVAHIALWGRDISSIIFPNHLYSLEITRWDDLRAIPRTVSRLNISAFNKIIDVGALPPDLEFLELPSYMHELHTTMFPKSLRDLLLFSWEELDHWETSLPPNLTFLYIPNTINFKCLHFPPSLKLLDLSSAVHFDSLKQCNQLNYLALDCRLSPWFVEEMTGLIRQFQFEFTKSIRYVQKELININIRLLIDSLLLPKKKEYIALAAKQKKWWPDDLK